MAEFLPFYYSKRLDILESIRSRYPPLDLVLEHDDLDPCLESTLDAFLLCTLNGSACLLPESSIT